MAVYCPNWWTVIGMETQHKFAQKCRHCRQRVECSKSVNKPASRLPDTCRAKKLGGGGLAPQAPDTRRLWPRLMKWVLKNLPVRFYLNASLRCIILPLPLGYGALNYCVYLASTAICLSVCTLSSTSGLEQRSLGKLKLGAFSDDARLTSVCCIHRA